MKTNFNEQLALFQLNVKPNIITPHHSEARCWHTSIKKPAVFNQPDINHEDSTALSLNPRKRKRTRHSSFESDEESDLTTLLPSSPPTFPVTSNEELNYISEQHIPTRSMSNLSIYYDAEADWSQEDDTIMFESKEVKPITNTSSSQPITASQPATPLPMITQLQSSSEPVIILPDDPVKNIRQRNELTSILFSSFGLREFIPNQYEAITSSLDDEDMLVVLPAGPPRDICYQLPTFFHHPKLTTLVIVPTIIELLQHDDHYIDIHKIPTAFVCGTKKSFKKYWIPLKELETVIITPYKVIYITYSDFVKGKSIIAKLYQENLLKRIVIDEAHCISSWGPDFHFGYLRAIKGLKTDFTNIPITALTAISNERVQQDIIYHLSIQNTCNIFNKSILL